MMLRIIFVFYLLCFYNVSPACITTYNDMAILGNDIHGVLSPSPTSCCQYYQNVRGCVAHTWTSFNNGTCWLKNYTQPLYFQSGSMTGIQPPNGNSTYSLVQAYSGANFFDNWFFSENNHIGPFNEYVNQTVANQLKLVDVQNGKAYIGIDNITVLPSTAKGRAAIRLESKYRFNSGLFLFSIDHMPVGNATWPGWWTHGLNWPNNGEIDVLEGNYVEINGEAAISANKISLHVRDDCNMYYNESEFFTGKWRYGGGPKYDCYENANESVGVTKGCSVGDNRGTLFEPFNSAGGGVFALQWEREKFIRTWEWFKADVPADIANENPNPNPDMWGMPRAYFTLGPNCTPDHFNNHSIVIDTGLCFSGYPGGNEGCEDFVRNNPQVYTYAYWLVNYVKVFCKPNEPCGYLDNVCEQCD